MGVGSGSAEGVDGAPADSLRTMSSREPSVRSLSREELDVLVGWARGEGWDPGLADAQVFWETDPDAYVGFDVGGELAGGACTVAYGPTYGFMGLYILRPGVRGRGLGGEFALELVRRMRSRLEAKASIAIEGVVAMTPFYERALGFTADHGTSRMRVVSAGGSREPGLVELEAMPLAELVAYDAARFGAPRERFLVNWTAPAGGLALAAPGPDGIRGYGVLRPTGLGYKVGPLFADDRAIAASILSALMEHAAGSVVSLDVPEVNSPGMELAASHGMSEVFRCIRMHRGPHPAIPWQEVFGVTTLELG